MTVSRVLIQALERGSSQSPLSMQSKEVTVIGGGEVKSTGDLGDQRENPWEKSSKFYWYSQKR